MPSSSSLIDLAAVLDSLRAREEVPLGPMVFQKHDPLVKLTSTNGMGIWTTIIIDLDFERPSHGYPEQSPTVWPMQFGSISIRMDDDHWSLSWTTLGPSFTLQIHVSHPLAAQLAAFAPLYPPAP